MSLPILWTPPQRIVILIILVILIVYASVRLIVNRAYVSDPQPITPPRALTLADKIDPNTADAATLAVLPMIGQKRGDDIVAYRERYIQDHPGGVAFKSLDDLLKIRGIGPSILDQMRPFLMFPTVPAPTTQP